MPLHDEKYLSFATFRKSGEAVATPIWVVPVSDGRIGFWTAMGTGKAKRLRNNSAVTVQPCDARGQVKPGSSVHSGTAEMVQSGDLFDEVQRKVREKYGFMTKVSKLLANAGPQAQNGLAYADTVVLVHVDDAS